ncbi:MAG: arsenite efflux transporter metallochaperone ArsD [Pirellulales bacterium]
MTTIHVYDRPMCCSTGVCGPSVDPVLPRFAADLDWLRSQGHQVDRYNLAQQPLAFTENLLIHGLLSTHGVDCLPVVLVDGQVMSRGEYPSREQLAAWVGDVEPAGSLPVVTSPPCSSSGKCC